MRRGLMVVGLIALGWVGGQAQAAQSQPRPGYEIVRPKPDFEIVITGASGDTEVKCVRGCKLSYQQYSGATGPIYYENTTDRVGFGCAKEQCEVLAAGFLQK